MSFANPWLLLLLLLLVPVWLLYWLRVRVPREVVGRGPFWQTALAEEHFRTRWQRWRMTVSLLLHSLTVIILALAAAGPAIPPPQRIVLILDNSATMRATDGYDTRFETAKTTIHHHLIASLRWCDQMAVVTTNPEPQEVQPFTGNQAILSAAVRSVEVQDKPPAIDWAIKVAREIDASQKPPARILLITDASVRDAVWNAQIGGVEVLRVGDSADNRAITCFTARRQKTEPTQCEVFVEVQNRGNESGQGGVELSVGDKSVESVPFAVEKDGRWQHLFKTLTLSMAARLTVRIMPSDAYPFDDTADLDIPAPSATPTVSGVSPGKRDALVDRKAGEDDVFGSEHTMADLHTSRDLGSDAWTAYYESPRLPLWIAPALAGVLLVMLEWCLYQRCWTS
jgi:hypothetical protein